MQKITLERLYIRVSEAGTADGLDDDLDLRIFQNGVEVLDEKMGGGMAGEVLGVEDVLHLNGFPRPAGHARCVAAEHLVHAAAHRAKA